MHNARRLQLECAPSLNTLDFPEAVNRVAQGIDRAPQVPVSHRHRKHLAGAAHFLAFLNGSEIAEDHHADLALFQVHGESASAVFEHQNLIRHSVG